MKFNKLIFICILIVISILALSSCKAVTGNVVKSPAKLFKCTGEAAVLLSDYCVVPETGALKLLFRNGGISDLKHLNLEIIGTFETHSTVLKIPIEMGESRLFEVPVPEDIGTPTNLEMKVYYFGNSGLENCVKLKMEYEGIRTCAKVKKPEVDPDAPIAPPRS